MFFDPLAITLVIATNQAFKSNKKKRRTLKPFLKLPPQVELQTPQVEEELPIFEEDINDPFEEHIDHPDEIIYEEEEPIVEEIVEEEPIKEIIEETIEQQPEEIKEEVLEIT